MEPHHDTWMAHNEDNFVWTTHHEDDGMDDSFNIYKYMLYGVAQWILTLLNTCQSSSFAEMNLLSGIFFFRRKKNHLNT